MDRLRQIIPNLGSGMLLAAFAAGAFRALATDPDVFVFGLPLGVLVLVATMALAAAFLREALCGVGATMGFDFAAEERGGLGDQVSLAGLGLCLAIASFLLGGYFVSMITG